MTDAERAALLTTCQRINQLQREIDNERQAAGVRPGEPLIGPTLTEEP